MDVKLKQAFNVPDLRRRPNPAKVDKLNRFLQVDLAQAAEELLAFVTLERRVFRYKAMPFGVVNAPALFEDLMNRIPHILRHRPLV